MQCLHYSHGCTAGMVTSPSHLHSHCPGSPQHSAQAALRVRRCRGLAAASSSSSSRSAAAAATGAAGAGGGGSAALGGALVAGGTALGSSLGAGRGVAAALGGGVAAALGTCLGAGGAALTAAFDGVGAGAGGASSLTTCSHGVSGKAGHQPIRSQPSHCQGPASTASIYEPYLTGEHEGKVSYQPYFISKPTRKVKVTLVSY
jgi:hypothetical protein